MNFALTIRSRKSTSAGLARKFHFLKATDVAERKAAINEWLERVNLNPSIAERHKEIRDASKEIGPPLGEKLQQHKDFHNWIQGNGPKILVCHGDGKVLGIAVLIFRGHGEIGFIVCLPLIQL